MSGYWPPGDLGDDCDGDIAGYDGPVGPVVTAADHFTSNERIEFDAQTAAARAVMDWIDADPARALVGCTPSMIATLAVNAYQDSVNASLEAKS